METKQVSTIIRLIVHSKRAERKKKSPCGRLVFASATNIKERYNNFQ